MYAFSPLLPLFIAVLARIIYSMCRTNIEYYADPFDICTPMILDCFVQPLLKQKYWKQNTHSEIQTGKGVGAGNGESCLFFFNKKKNISRLFCIVVNDGLYLNIKKTKHVCVRVPFTTCWNYIYAHIFIQMSTEIENKHVIMYTSYNSTFDSF